MVRDLNPEVDFWLDVQRELETKHRQSPDQARAGIDGYRRRLAEQEAIDVVYHWESQEVAKAIKGGRFRKDPPRYLTTGHLPNGGAGDPAVAPPLGSVTARSIPAGTTPQRTQVLKAKRVLKRCSARVRELIDAAAHAFPAGEEFSLGDLAAKIANDPGLQARTTAIRRHPKAQTHLVGALTSWRRNLSRPEKAVGQVLLERVDAGESPARYRVVTAAVAALAELDRPTLPADPEETAPVDHGQ